MSVHQSKMALDQFLQDLCENLKEKPLVAKIYRVRTWCGSYREILTMGTFFSRTG